MHFSHSSEIWHDYPELVPGVLYADGIGPGAAGQGLASIHAGGLVHRDLKPANIILASDGPRIIDFGIARAMGASTMTAQGTIIGTFTYMSPEQVKGLAAGPQSDVFSLGSLSSSSRLPITAPSRRSPCRLSRTGSCHSPRISLICPRHCGNWSQAALPGTRRSVIHSTSC